MIEKSSKVTKLCCSTLLSVTHSTVFCTVTCTAHITSCEHLLSCVITARVRFPGSHLRPSPTPLSLLCLCCMCILTEALCQTALYTESVGPRASIFTPACGRAPSGTFQLDRPEGIAGRDPDDLCVKPWLSLSHCEHVGDFTLFHIFFYLIHLCIFCSFLFFQRWEFISANSWSFLPRRTKARWGREEIRRGKRKVPETHFMCAGSQAERVVSSPPASCGFSLWPWCSVHTVCVHVWS